MVDAPKLLPTEQEWRKIVLQTYDEAMSAIRERGLIAPEPHAAQREVESAIRQIAEAWHLDLFANPRIARALEEALYHGMELAKPELTREMVREVLRTVHGDPAGVWAPEYISRFYAAILKQMERQQ